MKVAPGLKVGYLPGTGDEVQASLENLGVHATTLTMDDIAGGRLSGYDVVVLGVRAYAAHPGLAAANGQLLEYAKNGGVVIVQYNLGQFDYGPYPYSLGSAEKVVDETSAGAVADAGESCAELAEQDYAAGLRRMGGGARAWVYGELGPAVSGSAGDA